MKTPISFIIDDPAPIISVYHAHAESDTTLDGRPIVATYSNELLFRFCDIIEKRGIKGKFSIVPMPANKGDIINGLDGVSKRELDEWLDTVKTRVMKNFSVGPEMLTHNKAIDLATGKSLDLREDEFAKTQNRETLTPYIAKGLSLLKEAGIHSIGVTSPWRFGLEVEQEYEAAISQAVFDVTGSKEAWFFLRGLRDTPNAKPWVAREEDGRILVSIPATTWEKIWCTINTTDTSDEFVNSIADKLISEDGKSGELVKVLETGGYPILITHWQSLMSNGLGTGLRVMDEIARRINDNLSDKVEWMTFEEIMRLVIDNKQNYPKPKF